MKQQIGKLLVSASMIVGFAGLTVSQLCADEITFQNGVAGYLGMRLVTIKGAPETNREKTFKDSPTLVVSGSQAGNEGEMSMALIRFDDIVGGKANQIPPGSTVVSASLQLYKLYDTPKDEGQYTSEGGKKFGFFTAYQMFTPFDENASCFSYRAFSKELPKCWGSENKVETGPVAGVDYDRSSGIAIAMCPGKMDIWMSWDVSAMVNDWVKSSDSNLGLYLVTQTCWQGATFNSSKVMKMLTRPKLVVNFTPPAKMQ